MKYNLPDVSLDKQIHLDRYIKFIETRPIRDLKKEHGYNVHHILPKKLNGTDEKSNLIKLTPREHFIAHLILWKCGYPEMIRAFWYMNKNKRFSERITSKQFERMCIENYEIQSKMMKGTQKITNGKENSVISEKEAIPDGWYNGQANNVKGGFPLGSRLIHNGEETRYIFNEEIPDGWSYGRHEKRKWITNGAEDRRILFNEDIPEGWYGGHTDGYINITDGKNNTKIKINESIPVGWKPGQTKDFILKETVWINNGIKSKQVLPDEIPNGWKLGMADERMWVTNGKENHYIKTSDAIPHGFFQGRSSLGFWVNNGTEEIYCKEEIPDGYVKGRLLSTTKGKMWITNGIENKMVSKDFNLENGWKRGMIRFN